MHFCVSSVPWWVIITVIIAFTVFISFFVHYVRYTNSILENCKNIGVKKTYFVVTYMQFLWFLYRQKHPRAAILRFLSGFAKFFDSNIFLIWIGTRPVFFFHKAEAVEALLNNSVNITKSAEYDLFRPWVRDGLITSDGSKWRSHRKLLTQSFHFEILENFLQPVNEQASILTRKMQAECGKNWFDIVPLITLCALDIISETAMGVRLNTQTGTDEHCKKYVEGIHRVSEVCMYRVIRPWTWNEFIYFNFFPSGRQFCRDIKNIHEFTRKVIKEKKMSMLRKVNGSEEETAPERRKKKAFLELMLEYHFQDESFTEENLREEVDTFMFAGHDTVAMAMSFAIYLLGYHPKFQEKVFEELEDIFGCDMDRDITSEDIKRMKYLECVIKETLRLYPSVPFFGRQLTEAIKVYDYTLVPGVSCFVLTNVLHMDPDQFPSPDVFDPNRFLHENSSQRHPFSYVPFSAGSRNCIGQRFALMEQKTILAHVFRKFKVTSLDPRDKIEVLGGLVLKNAEPIRIRVTPRGSVESRSPF